MGTVKRQTGSAKKGGSPSKVSGSSENEAFHSNDEILTAATVVFGMRKGLVRLDPKGPEYVAQHKAERGLTRLWHASVDAGPSTVPLLEVMRKHRLSHMEREILAALLMDKLGLLDSRIREVADVLRVLLVAPPHMMRALRYLSEQGKLYRGGLFYFEDLDEEVCERKLCVDPNLLDRVLHGDSVAPAALSVRKEKDLFVALGRLTQIMQQKSDKLAEIQRGNSNRSQFLRYARRQKAFLEQLDRMLDLHPKWSLAKVRKDMSSEPDWMMLLALVGKTMEHIDANDRLFSGAGLARVVCRKREEFSAGLARLVSTAPLLQKGYVQLCAGDILPFQESPDGIKHAEFELTDDALQKLGLEETRREAFKKVAGLRSAQVKLSDLVLSAETSAGIQLALSHAQKSEVLMKQWGLGEVFSYGKGATKLFYGPPGTGKTATAEAIAHELNKPLLVVDYSKVQNCLVGQTEKNIASTFRRARQHNAVLFWDEADAMFSDRDKSGTAWEVRDVNVLLQEIERFDGVCILATNRKLTLDKALERRITAKVEFPRPDHNIRKGIWKRLIPSTLPVAADVDFASLAAFDLSGGEIKNVVLNAARQAVARGTSGPVTPQDFEKAVEMETRQGWSGSNRGPVGFV